MSKPNETSAFTTTHRVEITYPAWGTPNQPCQCGAQARIMLFPIANATTRYEPVPIIRDKAVIIHTTRDEDANGYDNTTIWSRTLAVTTYDSQTDLGRMLNSNFSQLPDLPKLVAEMEWITEVCGETYLDVWTYMSCHRYPGPSVPLIRICRMTSTPWPFGDRPGRTLDRTYEMKLADFEALPMSDAWYQNILDVIYRRTDQAVKHVKYTLGRRLSLEGPPIKDIVTNWLPKRLPAVNKYENLVARPLLVMTANAIDSDVCYVCRVNFDTTIHVALELLCCKQVMCRHCYMQAAGTSTPGEACCPFCRHKFFSHDPNIVETLTFGTVGGVYCESSPGNGDYNAWETFERSCADLDRQLAQNKTIMIFIQGHGLLDTVFRTFVKKARLEPAESTPHHMQPARSPEVTALINGLFANITANFDGYYLQAKNLYKTLMLRIFEKMAKRYQATGALGHVHDEVLRRAPASSKVACAGLPAEVCDFLERTLNRVLMFVLLRHCDCMMWRTHGIHKHGVRMHYGEDWSGEGLDYDPDDDELSEISEPEDMDVVV